MAPTPPKNIRIPINGVLFLDKPAGISSNDALVKAKRLLNAKKAGHTGTLDPFATGLLPLCFGEATKFAQDLLEADKTYETVVHLGVVTTTGDTEGEVLDTSRVDVSSEKIEDVLAQFRGEIRQVPPMYSALKRDGKPLYEYARAGITLEREPRSVTIRQLEFLEYQAPFLKLRVTCSKGTYIRVLGEDIGRALGCGAHLYALRRTQVANLSIDSALTLEALEDLSSLERSHSLQPPDTLLLSFPFITLSVELANRFLQGQRLSMAKEGLEISDIEGRVRVYQANNGALLGTGKVNEWGILSPERLICTA